MFPSSARARRRLLWLGAGLVVVVAGSLVLVLMPSKAPTHPSPIGNEGPAQLVTKSARVTPAERRAINATLDRWIPAALPHRDPKVAWDLSGPEMKSDSTFADWQRWSTPVPYYPAAGTTFHGWRLVDAGTNYVEFNLLVHPTPHAKVNPYVFAGEVVRRNGRWLVNRIYTIAIMNPVRGKQHEVGPADFAAPPPSSGPPSGQPRESGAWLLVAVGVIGLAVVVVAAFGLVSVIRARRWRRRARGRSGPSELPPLPSSYRPSEQREPVGSNRD